MKTIYSTRAYWVVLDDDFDETERQTISVYETDNEPIDTGLLDANGDRLFRVTEREPIGFI